MPPQLPLDPARQALEARWFRLTREVLPGMAAERRWPVRLDHCFQRILLDAACGGRWDGLLAARPAYRALDDGRLAAAVMLAEAVAAGEANLAALNERSLRWRGRG